MRFAAAFSWSLFAFTFSGGHITRALALVQHRQGQSASTRLSLAQRNVAMQQPDNNPLMSTETPPFRYTRSVKMRPPLDYFMGWHHDEVEFHTSMAKKIAHLGKGVSMLDTSVNISTRHGLSILAKHRAKYCPQWRQTLPTSNLISHHIDESGVQHMLFASRTGGYQYVAALSGGVVAADPPACPERPVSVLQRSPTITVSTPPATQTGVPQTLAVDDPLVQSCEGAFHGHMLELCAADETLTVTAAKEKLVSDGYAIEMTAQVGSRTHTVECDFNFTQALDGSGHHEADVNIRMHVDICEANSTGEPGVSFVRMGDTSRTKGLDWKVKHFPKVATSDLHVAFGATAKRDEVDIRTDIPECFPDNGRAVVRDQGLCGNCWAQAAASVAMTMICKSNTQQAIEGGSRFEISVQQLMRCNANQVGCNGGGAYDAKSAFTTGGIAKESVVPFQCGGGSALDHFNLDPSTKCEQFPWGDGQCDQNQAKPTWVFGQYAAMYKTNGEDDLKAFMAAGNPLYMTFDVYYNFMYDSWTIYEETQGDFMGTHAVAGLGYGSAGGTNYWLIQNSWGVNAPNSENGFQKFKRGINLCNIETEAFYIRTWAENGNKPLCFDSEGGTLVQAAGGIIPCSQAKSGNPYGINLCTYASVADTVKSQCPIACEVDLCINLPAPTTPAPTTSTTTLAVTTTAAATTTKAKKRSSKRSSKTNNKRGKKR